jgi:DNA-binding CsgD family transcriptional regulator
MDDIDRFLDGLSEFDNPDQLRDALAVQVSEFGFDYFAYHMVRPVQGPRQRFVVSNYPERWMEHYFDNDYIHVDAVLAAAVKSNSSISWRDLRHNLSPAQRQIFDEAGEFKINQGITIPVHGYGGSLATLTVGGDLSDCAFDDVWRESKSALMLAALYTHESASRMAVSGLTSEARLSPRERECLLWAARGKSAWETGTIIGTSERAVRFHFENVLNKLGVHSKIHAVVRAILTGQIVP